MDERRVIDIARTALRHPPEERAAFLDATCLNDAMRREVEALLDADAAASDEQFLEKPPLGGHDRSGLVSDAWRGRRIGPYVIEEEIGAGGMGVVYGARDARLGRRVALKVLPPAWGASAVAQERFLREARAASALDHPNICTIHEIDETDEGWLYTVMACYEGQTLAARLSEGRLSVDEAIDIFQQVATGLHAAHAAGITHRDVKPSNLFLTDAGIVKILDFGIAKLEGQRDLTADGRVMGTVAYMAPEQARNEPVDARTDVWALGVVAYEMLTGIHPFRRDTPAVTLHALQHDDPPPLSSQRAEVPDPLDRLVRRMLAKAPHQRMASMQAVLDALNGLGASTRCSLSSGLPFFAPRLWTATQLPCCRWSAERSIPRWRLLQTA